MYGRNNLINLGGCGDGRRPKGGGRGNGGNNGGRNANGGRGAGMPISASNGEATSEKYIKYNVIDNIIKDIDIFVGLYLTF